MKHKTWNIKYLTHSLISMISNEKIIIIVIIIYLNNREKSNETTQDLLSYIYEPAFVYSEAAPS